MIKSLTLHSQIAGRNLYHFPTLTALGVKNFMTDQSWGDMNMRFDDSLDSTIRAAAIENFAKYKEIVPENPSTIVRPANRYATQIIDAVGYQKETMGDHMVVGDGVITSTNGHYIRIAPADCAIIAITGIDEISGRRFLSVLHVGYAGADLGIISKAMSKVTALYQFNSAQLRAFVFPSISAANYKKPLSIFEVPYFSGLNRAKWAPYIRRFDDFITIDVQAKIIDQLAAAGIERSNITTEDACTYDLSKAGVLYSHTAQKELPETKNERFAVIVGIDR